MNFDIPSLLQLFIKKTITQLFFFQHDFVSIFNETIKFITSTRQQKPVWEKRWYCLNLKKPLKTVSSVFFKKRKKNLVLLSNVIMLQ